MAFMDVDRERVGVDKEIILEKVKIMGTWVGGTILTSLLPDHSNCMVSI
jgi:hypothetical protein